MYDYIIIIALFLLFCCRQDRLKLGLKSTIENLEIYINRHINILIYLLNISVYLRSLHRVRYSRLDLDSRSSITGLELVLFVTVISQSIMDMHVPYNTACFIHSACSCRDGSCLVGSGWLDSVLL